MESYVRTLASHHFRNPSLCYQEMNRVLKQNNGKIVIFTLDPRLCPKDLLILDYFGPVVEESYKVHPSINELSQLIEEQVRRPVNIRLFPLPYDLVDQFFFAGWRRPELYLDKDFQAVTSPLANGRKDIVTKCLERLNIDLSNGNWNLKYGEIQKLCEYDSGHFFLVI